MPGCLPNTSSLLSPQLRQSSARVGQLQEALAERHSIVNSLKAKYEESVCAAFPLAELLAAQAGLPGAGDRV